MHSRYRPEIDGLRAIAVLAVLFYHAKLTLNGIEIFSGGYIGVDIFFVISGYLITGILLREIGDGDFRIGRFYMRRARRILPALLFVIICCIPFAWLYLLPDDLIDFSESAIASILFTSNFLFWLEAGYFDSPNEIKPLIHTWSLAVEEQYYIFFPILLLAVKKWLKTQLKLILTLGLLASLAAAEYLSRDYPGTAFYLLPTRCWELFAGALIALHERAELTPRDSIVSRSLPLIGLMMIVPPLILFDETTRHPSILTIIPVLGCCLIIWYSRGTDLVGRLLRGRPVVWIGLISYSLYLWHQPILAFFRLQSANAPTEVEKLILISACIPIAWLSWWLVEQPFRSKNKIGTTPFLVAISIMVMTPLILASAGLFKRGFPDRYAKNDYAKKDYIVSVRGKVEKESRKLEQNKKKCFGRLPQTACQFGPDNAQIKIILMGDSHGGAIAPSLKQAALTKGWHFTTNNSSSCPYVPGFSLITFPDCARVLNVKRREAVLEGEYDIVILHSRLQIYIEGNRFDNQEGGRESGGDVPLVMLNKSELPESERIDKLTAAISNSIKEILDAGKKVVLIYPVPEVGWDTRRALRASLPSDLSARVKWLENKGLSTSHNLFQKRVKRAYAALDQVGSNPNLLRIYPEQLFCNTLKRNRCVTHSNTDIFYRDSNHLSADGAKLVVEEMMHKISKQWQF